MAPMDSISSCTLSSVARASAGSPRSRRFTSSSERITASGVRSSCEASATNRRCSATPRCSRSSIPFIVTARSWISSVVAGTSTRSSSRSIPISPAVWVILDTGTRAARASHQPPIPATRSRPGPANSNSVVSRPTEASTRVEGRGDHDDASRGWREAAARARGRVRRPGPGSPFDAPVRLGGRRAGRRPRTIGFAAVVSPDRSSTVPCDRGAAPPTRSPELLQRCIAHVLELPLARPAEPARDLRRSRGAGRVDPGHEVGAQPDHDEGAERRHQDSEQRDGPDRDPEADREAHGVPTW